MTLAELNQLNRAQFVEAIGWVCEQSPWVAERAWSARPFASLEQLLSSLIEEIEGATREEQLSLLRAHPDLGTRAAVSDASRGEQYGAGLQQLTPEEHRRLTAMNDEYRAKFGFPFLFAVKGSTKFVILENLERRLSSTADQELREALRQTGQIVRFRLSEFLKA